MTSKAEGLRDCEDLETMDSEIARRRAQIITLRAQNTAILEALRDAMDFLEHPAVWDIFRPDAVWGQKLLHHIQTARAAIAQAEGKTE